MGAAMTYAVDDIKNIIGMKDHHSDNEEQANEDTEYLDMSKIKTKYAKRRDSDQSINSNYLQRREDLYNVSTKEILFKFLTIFFVHTYSTRVKISK